MKRREGTTNVEQIQKATTKEEVVAILLENRGILSPKQRQEFFSPPHPEKLTAQEVGIDTAQLNKAVERIIRAIDRKQKIIVYGDYDVDGVCASAILWETLRILGAECLPYIPSRFTEGYGLNSESIKKLKEDDPDIKLIITVDNGIVAHEKINVAKDLGMDVIITDHHTPGETLPEAFAIVHTTQLSGSAVVWFLARSLLSVSKTARHARLTDHLGLAALGTVADVLPLVGHNRSIVVHGLQSLRITSRIGIQALCKDAGIQQDQIDTFQIGFVISPRMNAMGRLEHAMESLRLLCTQNGIKAAALAQSLGDTNRIRQEKTESILQHIYAQNAHFWERDLPGILFAAHETYEEGIVGIVAGRLVEKYYRPAIVMYQGQEVSKASARSITGINIVNIIREVGTGMLLSAGGHPMAAGFSLATGNIPSFQQKLQAYGGTLDEGLLVQTVKADCEIDFPLLGDDLYAMLVPFSPFGFGNPTPTFLTRHVRVEDVRRMGKENNHLKLLLTKEGAGRLEAVGFHMGNRYAMVPPKSLIDIVYSLEENSWNGKKRLQLKIRNVHLSFDT